MAKMGIHEVGFVPDETESGWSSDTALEELRAAVSEIEGLYKFKSIDQAASSVTEELVADEHGQYHRLTLTVAVRTDADIALAKHYAGKPGVVHVWPVDGRHIAIGDAYYPARFLITNRYDGLSTREVVLTVQYDTLTGLL